MELHDMQTYGSGPRLKINLSSSRSRLIQTGQVPNGRVEVVGIYGSDINRDGDELVEFLATA